MNTKAKALKLNNQSIFGGMVTAEGIGLLCLGIAFALFVSTKVVVASADNFTDVFSTSSFRGSFEWFKKFDWLGMIVQAVISIFSLIGVSLIVIRIMTSMLYLSAKGLWEEVHELKQTGSESDKDVFGLFGMGKTWVKGKAGTGLDAILGAVLVLLPDVKKYSDFGERSGQKFEEDVSISQYILKISLPTVLAIFFLAMGFNGTLVKGLAVTVDAMGTVADKAVSVNYSGFAEDLMNRVGGYKFMFAESGTEMGKLQESIAKDMYAKAVAEVEGISQSGLEVIGRNIEGFVHGEFTGMITEATNKGMITPQMKKMLDNNDKYYEQIGAEVRVSSSTIQAPGEAHTPVPMSEILDGAISESSTVSDENELKFHIFISQTSQSTGDYFALGE